MGVMEETKSKKKEKVDGHRMDAGEFLRQMHKGEFLFEVGEKLEALVEAIRKVKKGGGMTIKIDFKTVNQGSAATVIAVGECKIRPPERKRDGSLFYTDGKNRLLREDPLQGQFSDIESSFDENNEQEV